MTKYRTYACPGTDIHPAHQFSKLHHPSVEADPLGRFCPKCGYDSEQGEMSLGITAPHLAKTIGKATDGMYRAMEEGAQFRADMARESFGMDSDEVNNMKMTDMKDNLREGDTSDVPVNNPVSQTMDAAPSGMFGFQGQAGLGYSGSVSQGPFPNAGAQAQNALRQHHAKFTASSGQAGATVSNLPALETTAPGYRKRVS